MRIYSTRFGVVGRTEVKPDDLRDAISTLSFNKKVVGTVPAPGLGPATLLEWAEAELREGMTTAPGAEDVARRKAFTATIIAKMAVECLLDWYLSSSYIGFTLRPHAGTEEKLDALDAEELLAIGASLFRDVLFEPRNRAVHDYQGVDLRVAKHAYELARLFVRNTLVALSPQHCNIYYGPLDIARNDEARQRVGRVAKKKGRKKALTEADEFYFGGVGAKGEHGVLLSRDGAPSLSILESSGDGAIDIRYARLSTFTPELLREVLRILEKATPSSYDLKKHEQAYLLRTLNDAVTGRSSGSR